MLFTSAGNGIQMTRMKSFFLVAALLAAGIADSPAQVYSVNIVGYINLPVSSGLNLIVNQLRSTTDDLDSFIPVAPDGTVVFRFDPVSQSYSDGVTFFGGVGWYPSSGNRNDRIKSIPVGEGFFIHMPGSESTTTITLVGEVVLRSTNQIPPGYSLKGSIIPQAGKLATELAFPPAPGDRVYQWDRGLRSFRVPSIFSLPYAWEPDEPQVRVSEGFLVFHDPLRADSWWIREFSIGPPAPIPAPLIANSVGAQQPVIRRVLLPQGKVTLEVSNPTGEPYNIQFSTDGAIWNTLAEKEVVSRWTGSFTPGPKGYFKLSKSN